METPLTSARQRAFFQSGVTREIGFRREMLSALLAAIQSSEDELLAALHDDLRKSPAEAYASEIGWLSGEIRHALRQLRRWTRPQKCPTPAIAWPARTTIEHTPLGCCLILGPWNYPLQLMLGPLVAAIAAGNTAVLKPSELAPHTSAAVRTLVERTFPPDYITVIEGGLEVAQALLQEKWDLIFFTGGTHAGRSVMEAAARHLTPVILELGGKCPCIVTADAPPQTTARRILWGKTLNAGQTCVAPDFVLVQRSAAPALIAAMKQTLLDFFGENPESSQDFGRIINAGHWHRLQALLAHGTIVHGGSSNFDDLFIAPTLITGIDWDSPLMQEEIFGPILPILLYDDLDEVLTGLRKLPTPLAVYGFTASNSLRERVVAGTQSGGVCINDTIVQILGRDLPFGGVGPSGMGRYHGRAGFEAFSHPRVVMNRAISPDFLLRYPPARLSLRFLRFFTGR